MDRMVSIIYLLAGKYLVKWLISRSVLC